MPSLPAPPRLRAPTRGRVVPFVVAALLAAAAGAFVLLRAPAVPAVAVSAAPLVRTLQFSGRVASTARVDVGATVTGRVAAVLADAGDAVRAAAPLVRLEDDELRAALVQAEAGEAQARARLSGLRDTGRRGVDAVLAQAESVRRQARAERERALALRAQGFVSDARVDEAERALAVADAQLAAAQAQRGAVADGGSDIAQAAAQLAAAQAATQLARARLAQAVVRAPTDGRVLARTVEPGQIVQPGRALMTLALTGPPQLVAQVDERLLEELRVGQTAQVMADAFPGVRFEARVTSIAPLVDAQRGAVEVKLGPALPSPSPAPSANRAASATGASGASGASGPGGGVGAASWPDFLREDMTLSLAVQTARRERALLLPLAALRGAGDGAAGPDSAEVWVLADGRVAARRVRVGLRSLESAEVLEGLAAGEVVLVGPAPGPGARARADIGAAPLRTGASGAGSALTGAMGR